MTNTYNDDSIEQRHVCSICDHSKDCYYNICDCNNELICNECIYNLECTENYNCPYCRKNLNTKVLVNKHAQYYNLLTSLISKLYMILCEIMLPVLVINLQYIKKYESYNKSTLYTLLFICVFIIRYVNESIWVYIDTNNFQKSIGRKTDILFSSIIGFFNLMIIVSFKEKNKSNLLVLLILFPFYFAPFIGFNLYFVFFRIKCFLINHSNINYKYIRIMAINIVYFLNNVRLVQTINYNNKRRRRLFFNNRVYSLEQQISDENQSNNINNESYNNDTDYQLDINYNSYHIPE